VRLGKIVSDTFYKHNKKIKTLHRLPISALLNINIYESMWSNNTKNAPTAAFGLLAEIDK
jgi:hypothetical protein